MAKSQIIVLLLLIIHCFSSFALVSPRRIIRGNKITLSTAVASTKDTKSQVTVEVALPKRTAAAAVAVSPKRGSKATKESKSNMKSNNLRWAIYGVATELFHNIFLRTLSRVRTRLFATKTQQLDGGQRYRQPPKHELAVVTGATGGIGSQIAHDLAFRGYDVVIAARDKVRGDALVIEIQGLLKVTPLEESNGNNQSGKDEALPTISFVEYHADVPASAIDVASSIKGLGSPLSVLILNAGIMGKSKQLTMQVNLVGPAMLTFALLPLMAKDKTQPTVINVGSSAHLRATGVIDEQYLPLSSSDDTKQSYIESLPEVADDDLSTYAQSKLALMQFSTLLRHWLPKSDLPPIHILDAHPGLVWTPLLRNHIGDKAVGMLTNTGLASLIYKSSAEGAQAIVSALDYAPTAASASKEQMYFVNGKPGGYAAWESASFDASRQLWKYVLAPEVEGVVDLPKGWGLGSKD